MGQNENIAALQQLGQSHVALRQWRKARKIYRQILKLFPDHAEALLKMAQIALATKKYKEARGHLERLLAEDPNHLEALLLWVELLHQSEPRIVLTRVMQALKAHPEHVGLHLRAAELSLQLKLNEQASDCLEKIQTEQLQGSEDLHRLQKLLLRAGHLKRAADLAPQLQSIGGQDLESRWQALQDKISPEQWADFEASQKGNS